MPAKAPQATLRISKTMSESEHRMSIANSEGVVSQSRLFRFQIVARTITGHRVAREELEKFHRKELNVELPSRPSLRTTAVSEEPRIHGGCDNYAGTGDWR